MRLNLFFFQSDILANKNTHSRDDKAIGLLEPRLPIKHKRSLFDGGLPTFEQFVFEVRW